MAKTASKKITKIGIGHTIRALQLESFGHEEVMAMREAMINNDFSKIKFCEDSYFTKIAE
jgi:hypothetical protein